MVGNSKYKGLFENDLGTSEIVIENNFEYLKFKLGTFIFEGTSFDDFELLNYENYLNSSSKQFSLNPIKSGQKIVYELCDCIITVCIPTLIKNIETNEVFNVSLEIKVKIGKSFGNGFTSDPQVVLSLTISDQTFSATNYDFEDAANEIKNQMKSKYKFNNCFGCNFSDYSPYGKSIFGSMLCFKNQKEKYSKVKDKSSFFSLDKEDQIVQETYSCEEFEIRKNNIGYRG